MDAGSSVVNPREQSLGRALSSVFFAHHSHSGSTVRNLERSWKKPEMTEPGDQYSVRRCDTGWRWRRWRTDQLLVEDRRCAPSHISIESQPCSPPTLSPPNEQAKIVGLPDRVLDHMAPAAAPLTLAPSIFSAATAEEPHVSQVLEWHAGNGPEW